MDPLLPLPFVVEDCNCGIPTSTWVYELVELAVDENRTASASAQNGARGNCRKGGVEGKSSRLGTRLFKEARIAMVVGKIRKRHRDPANINLFTPPRMCTRFQGDCDDDIVTPIGGSRKRCEGIVQVYCTN